LGVAKHRSPVHGADAADPPWDRTGDDAGIALVMVLWVLTLIMVVGGQFAFTVRQELQSVRRFKESAEAHYIAEAGLVEALLALGSGRTLAGQQGREEGENESPGARTEVETEAEAVAWRINAPVGPIGFSNGQFRITIGNDSGRIDLNTADAPLLRMAVGSVVADEDQTDEIVDAILDWRDGDEFHRLNGAESDYYETLPVPYRSKNGPFDTVDELLFVKGVTPDLFFGGLEGMLTVQQNPFEGSRSRSIVLRRQAAAGGNRINPNAAPAAVLKALPEMTEDLVKAVLTYRQDRDFATFEDIADVVGPDVLAAISPYITFELSPYYTIQAEGMVNDSSVRQRLALRIRMDPTLPDRFEILQRIEG
jgi:general secretion pathway protein K